MFFKNLRLFQLTEEFKYSQEDLESQLAEELFTPCSNYDKSSLGWVSPMGDAAPELEAGEAPMLTHVVGDFIMLCAQRQERLLPASVVREATEEKVAEIEARQARKIYRKEKRDIQEQIFARLLPQAFTRSQQLHAYIDRKNGLLVVNSASAPRAEELVNLLRDSLESLPVALPATKTAPAAVLTHWLKSGKGSDRFQLNEDAELLNPRDASNIVRYRGQDLHSEELTSHLEAGKQAKALGLGWNSVLHCVVADDLAIKRLQFEAIEEDRSGAGGQTPAQRFDQEFALMTLELRGFLQALFTAFGGLDKPRPLARKNEED